MQVGAAFWFVYDLLERLLFIVPAFMKMEFGWTLFLYVFDIIFLVYFGKKQRYCPGTCNIQQKLETCTSP